MTLGAAVVEVRVETLDVPLKTPFGIAGGSQDIARNLLVSVTLEDGTVGYGEAAPLPAFNGETQASARAALESASPSLLRVDATRWRRNARLIGDAARGSGAARCALETALLDAATKRAGISLVSFFGGAVEAVTSDITIPLGSKDDAEAAATNARDLGFDALKIKVGGGDLDLDVARVLIAARIVPRAKLLLDGNCGLTVADAVELALAIRRAGLEIELFEQPTTPDDPAALGEVRRRAEVRVAADESATSATDVANLARLGVDVINVKLMKSGVAGALDLAIAARAHGLRLMIGGMVETRLAMGMSACLAAGLGEFSYVDLDTPLFLARDPFEGGYTQVARSLELGGVVAGHGLRPRDALPRLGNTRAMG